MTRPSPTAQKSPTGQMVLNKVVDDARRHGLQEVADRLIELDQQPLDEDEAPLRAEAAMKFVEYCVDHQQRGRPLMTVTPDGELDATWKGPEDRVTMRFFSDGSVWVAYGAG